MKLGRNRPANHQDVQAPHRRIKLAKYVQAKEPSIALPSSFDYSLNAAGITDAFLNQILGCCVIAAGYHGVGVATGNAGDPFVATDNQITEDYSAIGNYVPGDPSTDNGCDEVTALAYWQTKGFANGTKLLTFVEIDGTNWNEVKLAAYLFEQVIVTAELPDEVVASLPTIQNGFVWKKGSAPNPQNGHAVAGFGVIAVEPTSGQSALEIDSWGLKGLLTQDFVGYYAIPSNGGGVYALLTPDLIAKGQVKDPNGVDWATLQADIASLPPVDSTQKEAAKPAPVKVQTQAPTRDAIQAALTIALSKAAEPLSRIQAIQVAVGALIAKWPGEKPAGATRPTRAIRPGATPQGAAAAAAATGAAPAPDLPPKKKSLFEAREESLRLTPQPKNWKRPLQSAFASLTAKSDTASIAPPRPAPRPLQPPPHPGPRPEPRPGPRPEPRPGPNPEPSRRAANNRRGELPRAAKSSASTDEKLRKLGFGK